MKKLFLIAFTLITVSSFAQFDRWFHDKTLRMDYVHSGNDRNDYFTFDEFYEEPFWGGSKTNLIDDFNYGKYYVKVFDKETKQEIYSRGFSTLFMEWKTTNEAKITDRSMTESVVMPFPKKDAMIEIHKRNKKGEFEKCWVKDFKVNDYFINRERRLEYPSFDVHISGDPAKMVDIVILPEGYTEAEMGKFIQDCKNFKESLFSFDPYDKNTDKFNIRGVLAPSPESGSDIPADSVWVKTLLNTRFYTFDLERYVMTHDFKSVRDLAANAPYDQIYILVNTPKYGGGAIYNFYSSSVSGNKVSGKIIIHEFGHAFVGLGDEYFSSKVAYNDFYPLDIEPWEPNITTLVDFDSKWKSMLPEGTEIPTPIDKNAPHKIGVFEGAGYTSKGIYRPADHCLMRSFLTNEFCPVCKAAIQRMIDFYTK